MFTPTQKELDQLGFTNIRSMGIFARNSKEVFIKRVGFFNIEYKEGYARPWSIGNEANDIEFYPMKINDVCTVINIFNYEVFLQENRSIVND